MNSSLEAQGGGVLSLVCLLCMSCVSCVSCVSAKLPPDSASPTEADQGVVASGSHASANSGPSPHQVGRANDVSTPLETLGEADPGAGLAPRPQVQGEASATPERPVDRDVERSGPLVCSEQRACSFDSDCEAGAGCFHTECGDGPICIAGDPCLAGCGHENCMIGDAREVCEVSGNPDCDPEARIWVLLCE